MKDVDKNNHFLLHHHIIADDWQLELEESQPAGH